MLVSTKAGFIASPTQKKPAGDVQLFLHLSQQMFHLTYHPNNPQTV
ncbi:hypothetical protein [Scytonema sp. NUACC26]